MPAKANLSEASLMGQVSTIVQSPSFKQAIEQMLETKLQPVLWKIGQLDQKLQSLERRLESIELTAVK